jgi:hypothetical protein
VPDYGSIAVVTGMLHRKDTKTGVLPSFRDSAAKDSQAPSTMLSPGARLETAARHETPVIFSVARDTLARWSALRPNLLIPHRNM